MRPPPAREPNCVHSHWPQEQPASACRTETCQQLARDWVAAWAKYRKEISGG